MTADPSAVQNLVVSIDALVISDVLRDNAPWGAVLADPEGNEACVASC